MHELLRQNAIDNHKALKDARGAMTGEINARIDQISREQFKEVQIYIDKIKERVSVSTVMIWVYRYYQLAFSPPQNMNETKSISTQLVL